MDRIGLLFGPPDAPVATVPLRFADAGEADARLSARTWRLLVPDFGVLEGPFLVAALEYAGEHEGEASFAISLASAGELTFEAL